MIQHRHYIMLMPLFVAMVSFSHAAEQTPLKQELVLGTSGTAFTLNGTETFLLGASYYGALGIEDPKEVEADLRDLTRAGINWIRVWATWESDTVNISAVAPDGTLREPYMKRLVRLCERAQQQHMAVDVTVTRNKGSVYPSNQKEHCAVLAQLAQTLKPFRHVYFDVANERNIGDARHVPMDEVRDLIATVKSIDPQRLCTASQGGDISEGELKEYLMTAKVDFITPHRPRNPDSIRLTVTKTREYFHNMEALPHTVPILYQEPFRRGYSDWEPTVSDFLDDMQNARRAGAAGWCWHNGANKSAPDKRPRKSFDMRPSEGRLFKQLDSADQTVLSRFQPPPQSGVVFPGTQWLDKAPEMMGGDPALLKQISQLLGGRGCIVLAGYRVMTWGDQSEISDWYSASKPVLSTLLFFAYQEGRIKSVDQPIADFGWPLSPKDSGITFRHLGSMTSGYARPEMPGKAWAYNDYAIQLYQMTLFDKVFKGNAQTIAEDPMRLGPLGFQDGLHFSAKRRLRASVRDFARIVWFWTNKGRWGDRQLLQRACFNDFMKPQTPKDLPQTREAKTDDYLQIGTYGGESNHFSVDGPGTYGFNWWFNDTGRTHPDTITWPDAPRDTVMAIGAHGNCAAFVPSMKVALVCADGNWNGTHTNEALRLLVAALPKIKPEQ